MADLSDVLNALVALVDGVIYPSGDSNPSALIISGSPVTAKIFPGWPIPDQLDQDLAANVVNISVFAPPGMERNTTRYPRDWRTTAAPPAATITASIDPTGTVVTFGGTISTPQNVAIIANDVAVAHAVLGTDTLQSIATALAAALTAAGIVASAVGLAVTIPSAHSLVARVGTVGTAQQEVKRQVRLFQVTIWAPAGAPAVGVSSYRDAAVKLIDPVLAATNFLALADGSTGRLIYQRTMLDDGIQKVGCYRRDLFYSVEYGTTVEQAAAEAIVITTTMQGAAPPVTGFTPSSPPPLVFNA